MAKTPSSTPPSDHGGHDHDHGHAAIKAAPEVRTFLAIVVGIVVLATVIGLFLWRAEGSATAFPSPGDRVNATVISDDPEQCDLFGFGTPDPGGDFDDGAGFFDDFDDFDDFGDTGPEEGAIGDDSVEGSVDPDLEVTIEGEFEEPGTAFDEFGTDDSDVFFGDDPGGFDPLGGQPVDDCVEIAFEVTSGPNKGGIGSFQLYLSTEQVAPSFSVGDKIVVYEFQRGDTGIWDYTFADRQRGTPMVWLAILFAVAVLALGRFQGVRALAGLVASVAVIFFYVLPALLEGQSPLPVAIVAASVIAFASLYLTHGFNDTTTVALLGTLSALGLTGVLGALFTGATQISGLESDDQRLLAVFGEGIDFRGLVLAGIVLGTLGVLDDVTVTQVSAVARLREANPNYTARQLYAAGVRIGRDHIAATVNTLVLAYAGAALPLFLYYTNIGMPLGESITQEIIAVEVVRTLVGSIGLVAAVPITTGLAAVVVSGTSARALRFLPALPTTRGGRAGQSR